MRISVRRAGAGAGPLALAAVTALGGAATASPGSKAKSPSRAMAEAAHGASGGSGKLTVVAEGLDNPRGFVLGHHHAYITNNSILSDAGQVVKVRL